MKLLLMAAAMCGLVHAQLGALGSLIDKAKNEKNAAASKAKPVTDRAGKAADVLSGWSPEQEEEIGEAAAAKMIHVFGLVDSPKMASYVNLVGSSVAQYAPRQVNYRFGVLDTDIVGAFALPGGFIFITRAALDGMKNEAELAGALGHEIIHVSEKHLESEVRARKTSAWAIAEAKSVRAPAGTEVLRRKADALVSDLLNMKLSREKELGADERGSALAARAGYAPQGLRDFLTTLASVQSTPPARRAMGQLLSTHPPLADRLARLKIWLAKNPQSGQTVEARFRKEIK